MFPYSLTLFIILTIYLCRCLSTWMIQSMRMLSSNLNQNVSLNKYAIQNRDVFKLSVMIQHRQQQQQPSLLKRGPVWETRPTHHPVHNPKHFQPMPRVIQRIRTKTHRPRRALTIFFQPTTRRIFL